MFFYSEATDGPIDPYFSNVSLLIKADGDNNSTVFTDSSNNNLAISRIGNTKISTTQSKYGGSSAYFDGGSGLFLADNNAFTFDGDFTIEAWVYMTNTAGARSIISHWSPSSFSFRVDNGKPYLAYKIGTATDVGIQGTSTLVSANTWTHVAVTRSGSTIRFFVNGIQDASTFTASGGFANSTNVVSIGSFSNGVTLDNLYSLAGYIDDLRVTKGIARYTENFTPPDSHPTT
jgi:hypothetical protein